MSGYSFTDFLKANGFRRAVRLAFREPFLIWQMLGVNLMRRLLNSVNLHVLVESNGLVLDRQFKSDSITTPGTALNRPDFCGYISIPRKTADVPSKPGSRNSNLFKVTVGYLILYLTRGRTRIWMDGDCVTTARWYLDRAGVRVPQSVWTVNGLVDFLTASGYKFVTHSKELDMGAPKIPKQEPMKVAAAPPPPNPSAVMIIPGRTRKPTETSSYSSRSSMKGKRALTIPRPASGSGVNV